MCEELLPELITHILNQMYESIIDGVLQTNAQISRQQCQDTNSILDILWILSPYTCISKMYTLDLPTFLAARSKPRAMTHVDGWSVSLPFDYVRSAVCPPSDPANVRIYLFGGNDMISLSGRSWIEKGKYGKYMIKTRFGQRVCYHWFNRHSRVLSLIQNETIRSCECFYTTEYERNAPGPMPQMQEWIIFASRFLDALFPCAEADAECPTQFMPDARKRP